MRKRSKYYIYFFVAALLLQLIALFKRIIDPPTDLEFTLYDTNYIIDEFLLVEFGALFYFILALGYWILYKLRRKPSRTLASIHTVITIGSFVVYQLTILFQNTEDGGVSITYYRHNETLIMLLIPFVGLAQLLYLINIYIGIQNSHRNHRRKKREY